jgi:N-acyl amino acid synthase of PEP-CTERM/exosortase system
MSTDTAVAETLAHSYTEYFDVVRADTPALLDEAYRIRYQVYCVENPFENAREHEDGRETDVEDERSVHALLVHRPSGLTAGTVRVILPTKGTQSRPLPIQRVIGSEFEALLGHLALEGMGEISRFSVSKEFRRRCGEERYADIGFPHPRRAIDERRLMPYITYGLIQGAAEICSDFQLDHVCAVMEPALIRLLSRIGVLFEPVGELVEYHGLRQPCVASVADGFGRLRKEQPLLWHWIGERTWQPREGTTSLPEGLALRELQQSA